MNYIKQKVEGGVSAKSTSRVLEVLSGEPCTPNEIAIKLGINQKTAQTVLLDLASSGQIRVKKVGRYRIFWKASGNKK